MILRSPVFQEGGAIPVRYTGEGEDVSPPLEWSNVPSDCKQFALICEDPDAPESAGAEYPFVHWLIYAIPPSVSALPEGLPTSDRLELPVAARQGMNSSGKVGYSGPMPPRGHGAHHYKFTLFALNEETGLPARATKKDFLKAIAGNVIAQATLTGTYERSQKAIA